ncbi:hypothetical protein MM193_00500 [Limosilactobacillus reuteri]|uniref:hypothetical protein n=1 Tax=Limosilactobacillus reuteri TaxID=1598 RepID=UPI001F4ECBE7|nr:hypothetical protein [Limosilactobacillus reuteri]MCH9393178.1 hypothetical protein [Limosilactobacillus reuteri]
MEQIIKNQPDWDDVINKNFSKFSNSGFSNNVIYLNGAKKDDTFPLWYRCYSLGECKIYAVQGYVDMPDLAPGQTVDVFNIPAITDTPRYVNVQTVASSADAVLTQSESANGTFAIKNTSSSAINNWHPRYSMLIICNND